MGKMRTASRRRVHSSASVDDSWQVPPLSPSERSYMIRKAKKASVALVDHAHTLDGPVQWHYTGKLRGIQMYRGEGCYDRGVAAGTEFLCGVTTMMGTIEEVAGYFDQQTTEQMLAKKADDVLDCGVLYSLVESDSNNPFYRVSAKYQLYEGPSTFSRERDYCYLECQNTFQHASGRRGWVLSMHSIKLPDFPELEGVVRGSMYQSGYVFVEAEKEGYMDVMHSLQINFKSSSRLPHFMLNSALKRRILSIVTISREIQTTRMGRQTLLKKKQLMPKRSRALCVNCTRKFSFFIRKTRCRVCGEVVCQSCAPQVMISTKQGPVKTRVCTRCCHLSTGDDYEMVEMISNSPNNGSNPRRLQRVTRYSDILQDQHDHLDMYHEEDDDSLDEDEDGLEEQSDYSVFAQSRFTEASRNSLVMSRFGSSKFENHFEESSQFDVLSELSNSQYYDGGSSENSFVSDLSSSQWKGGNSAASSMMGRNQTSSVKPADGHMYDPQASTSSNFYEASNYSSDCGGSTYALNEDPQKRPGRHNAAAPIPEDRLFNHRGHNISPSSTYNSTTDYNSARGAKLRSVPTSKSKVSRQVQHKLSPSSQNSDTSSGSKTVSIQSLAKARSARYGIKSQFPPPPPPPSPSPTRQEEREKNGNPLHLDALKSDNRQSFKDRKSKAGTTRKTVTPPLPKTGRRETDRSSVKRASQIARNMPANAAVANRGSRVSRTNLRESSGSNSTQSSAILEQVRRGRGGTFQHTPDSDGWSGGSKSRETEHTMRMREAEQEMANEKTAQRLVASNKSQRSMQATQNDVLSAAAARKKKEHPRHNSLRSTAGFPSHSSTGAPPGSPPGTPPSLRGRRLPNNASFKSQSTHSRRENANYVVEESGFLSNRSNAAFVQPDFLATSPQSEDHVAKSQRSGHCVSKTNDYVKDRGLDDLLGTSKGTKSLFVGRQLDATGTLTIPELRHPDGVASNASHLALDKQKLRSVERKASLSSNIAILETPGELLDHSTIMERFSKVRSLSDSLSSEDMLSQSLTDMTEHIKSLRACAAYKLPDENDRLSDELRGRQEEHRKRMEELTKKMAMRAVDENVRDSTSTLGDLHDSSVSLTGYFGDHFGDSTISSMSSGSVNVDDESFDFDFRPLGRTKCSSTILFTLEDLEQGQDMEGDKEVSEGLADSNTLICQSEEYAERDKSEQGYGCRSSDDFAYENIEVSLPACRYSEEYVENKHEDRPLDASYRFGEEHTSVSFTLPRRLSVESERSEHVQTTGFATPPRRPIMESVKNEIEHDQNGGLGTLLPHSNVEVVKSKHNQDTCSVSPAQRLSVTYDEGEYDDTSELATSPRRSSVESVEPIKSESHQDTDYVTPPRRSSVKTDGSEYDHTNGLATSLRRSSVQSVEPMKSENFQHTGFVTPPRRSSVKSERSEYDHTNGLATSLRRSSVESVEPMKCEHADYVTPPRRSSVETDGSEYDHTNGLATSLRRSSVQSVELVKSEDYQDTGFVTPPRRSSVKSERSEYDHTNGLATSLRRSSVESVEPMKCEHAGFVTPPRRSSVETDGSEYDHTSGLATPPRRASVESVELVKSEDYQDTGFATPPRRSSVQSERSEYDHTSGLATPPRRASVESVELVKSEDYQDTGFATPPRRSSVQSERSEYDHTSGLATPPRRASVESVELVKSEDYQDTGFATPPRRSSVGSVELMKSEDYQDTGFATLPRRSSVQSDGSEYDHTNGLATSLRRSSVESVEPMKCEHAGFVTPPRRSSVETDGSEYGHTSGLATPPRRASVESVELVKSEDYQDTGFATPPRRSSVQSERSEYDHTSGLATPPRRASVESVELVKSEDYQDTGFATPPRRSSVGSVELMKSEDYQDTGFATLPRRSSVQSDGSEYDHTNGLATSLRRSSVESVEPMKCEHAGFVTPPRRSSVETDGSEYGHTSGLATPPRRASVESVELVKSEDYQDTGFATPPRRSSVQSERSEYDHTSGLATPPRRASVESVELVKSEDYQDTGFATPPRRSSVGSVELMKSEDYQDTGFATLPRRSSVQSDGSEYDHTNGLATSLRRSSVESVEPMKCEHAGFVTPPRRSSVETDGSEYGHTSGLATPPRRASVESVELVKSEDYQDTGFATPPRRSSVQSERSEYDHTSGLATPPRRASVESVELVKSEDYQDTGFATPPRRSSVQSERSEYDHTSGLATPPRRASVESVELVKSEDYQDTGFATPPRRSSVGSVELMKSEDYQDTGFATLPRRSSVQSDGSEYDHTNGLATSLRRSSVESVEPMKCEHAGFVTPPRRSSVETDGSEYGHTSGLATPPRRASVESVELVKSEDYQDTGFATPPRRSSVQSERSEYDHTSGLATPPRRASVESVELVKSEDYQDTGFATPPRRSSVGSVELMKSEDYQDTGFATLPRRSSVQSDGSEYDHTNGLATSLRRSSVESVEPMKCEHAGFVTPPRRSSVETDGSEYGHTSGLATPPRRASVESVELVKSEDYQDTGFATPPRRSSVQSERSEYDHTSGLATPPRRASVESVELVKSEDYQDTGFATPPRRSSVQSERSEYDHTSGLATPPRRASVESVELVKSEDYQDTGFATPPRRSSVGSVELMKSEDYQDTGFATLPRRSSVQSDGSEYDYTNGLATSLRRSSVESVEPMKCEHAGFVTPPRRSSVETDGSGYGHTNGLATSLRRSSVQSVEPMKSENFQHTGFVTPPRRSSVKSERSEYDHTNGLATSLRRSSVESVEPMKCEHAGFVTPPRRSSVETDESEYDHTSGLATPPRRASVESVELVKSEDYQDTGFATPPRRSSVQSERSEYDHTSGLATSLRSSGVESESNCEEKNVEVTKQQRQSIESDHLPMAGLATIPRHQIVESAESERTYKSKLDSARLPYSSSEDFLEQERDSDVEVAAHRSSEKPVANEHKSDCDDAESAYRSGVTLEYDLEHVESACHSSNETNQEDATTESKHPSNEPFVSGKSIPNFQPQSSQLMLGEGGVAVDAFFAGSSQFVSDGKLYQVDENGDGETCSPCATSKLYHLLLPSSTSEECNLPKTPLSASTLGTDMLQHTFSPRESCMSAIDEELMNRPTIELFDMIRANRPAYMLNGSHSEKMMCNLEESHMQRMEELNRIAIDHLGNRISNLGDGMLNSTFHSGQPLHSGLVNEEKKLQWRSSDIMEEVHNKHQIDMERLRRRIRQLEEECRESIAEQMDLSEFDDDDDSERARKNFSARQSFNPQSSFMARSDLSSSTISELGGTETSPTIDEPLPARVLFEQIAQLTRLQQEMAEVEDDEEKYRERIKEQYRVLQSIKAKCRQEHESLSFDEREALSLEERDSVCEDEENWI